MKLFVADSARSERRGSLLLALLAVVVVSGLASAAFMMGIAQKNEVEAVGNRMRAMYMAEAGVSETILLMSAAVEKKVAVPMKVGDKGAPRELKGGRFWCDIGANGDGSFTVVSSGQNNLAQRSIEVVLAPREGGIFDHAIFAGNSSNDVNYTMKLGGTGGSADVVRGDIYSGGNIEVNDDATLVGDAEAAGTISGVVGTEGVSLAVPDIAGMDYATNHDFDVAALFSGASWQSDDTGGSAWQMPESSPAHIFRKDPDDRTDETSSTTKSDYFLEDPYEPLKDFTAPDGKSGHNVTLSGTMGDPGVSSTDKVFFIDGNLWIHNKPFGRMRFFNSAGEGVRVTFVVKGNIYISDDIYVTDNNRDGVAFIAIKDDKEPDSGNVYLGDPRYGTVEYLESFLYAENNFYDNNLDAAGSKEVEIRGIMTAGNKVEIERDYDKGDGTFSHSQLRVDFDDRVSTGSLTLPGLPQAQTGNSRFRVIAWRELGE